MSFGERAEIRSAFTLAAQAVWTFAAAEHPLGGSLNLLSGQAAIHNRLDRPVSTPSALAAMLPQQPGLDDNEVAAVFFHANAKDGGLVTRSVFGGSGTGSSAFGTTADFTFTIADGDGANLMRVRVSDVGSVIAPSQANNYWSIENPETLEVTPPDPLPASDTAYVGGDLSIVEDPSMERTDPAAGMIWVRVDEGGGLGISIDDDTGETATERASLRTRYRPHSPLGRVIVWRGREWHIDTIDYPDRLRTMILGLVRRIGGE